MKERYRLFTLEELDSGSVEIEFSLKPHCKSTHRSKQEAKIYIDGFTAGYVAERENNNTIKNNEIQH